MADLAVPLARTVVARPIGSTRVSALTGQRGPAYAGETTQRGFAVGGAGDGVGIAGAVAAAEDLLRRLLDAPRVLAARACPACAATAAAAVVPALLASTVWLAYGLARCNAPLILLDAAATVRGVAEVALAQMGAIRARFAPWSCVAVLRSPPASNLAFCAADTDALFVGATVLPLGTKRGHRADSVIPALPIDAGSASRAAHIDAKCLTRRTDALARVRVLDLSRRTIEGRAGAGAGALAGVGVEPLAGRALDFGATAFASHWVLRLSSRTAHRRARARTGRHRSGRRRGACLRRWRGCRIRLREVPVRSGLASHERREAGDSPACERLEHPAPRSVRMDKSFRDSVKLMPVHGHDPEWRRAERGTKAVKSRAKGIDTSSASTNSTDPRVQQIYHQSTVLSYRSYFWALLGCDSQQSVLVGAGYCRPLPCGKRSPPAAATARGTLTTRAGS
jgi:hypothetical protein